MGLSHWLANRRNPWHTSPFGCPCPCGIRQGWRWHTCDAPRRYLRPGSVGFWGCVPGSGNPGRGHRQAYEVRPFVVGQSDLGCFPRGAVVQCLMFPKEVVVDGPSVQVALPTPGAVHSAQRLGALAECSLQTLRQVIVDLGAYAVALDVLRLRKYQVDSVGVGPEGSVLITLGCSEAAAAAFSMTVSAARRFRCLLRWESSC